MATEQNSEAQIKNVLQVANQLSLNDLDHLVRQLLYLQAQRRSSILATDEAELLLRINQTLPPDHLQRYEVLFAKRQAETLTPAEQQELIELTEQFEALNLQRLKYLSQLAQIRQISLSELMTQLGIEAPSVV